MGENLLIKRNLLPSYELARRLASAETKDIKSSNQIFFENSIAGHSNIVCLAAVLIEKLEHIVSGIFRVGKIYRKHFFASIRFSLRRK